MKINEKNGNKIDNRTSEEIRNFIGEEILASRIWVFSGIVISILLCQILKDYVPFELGNLVQTVRSLKIPDMKGISFIILFIVELFLLFFLPKLLIDKTKKNMKLGLIFLSLLTGAVLGLFYENLKFFIAEKTVIALIMIFAAIILIFFLIRMDVGNMKLKLVEKTEKNGADVLDKVRFFSALLLYADIAKAVILYLVLTLFI